MLKGLNKELREYYKRNKEVLLPVSFSEIVGDSPDGLYLKVLGNYYTEINIKLDKSSISGLMEGGFGDVFTGILINNLNRYDWLEDYENVLLPMWRAGEIGGITEDKLKYEVVKEANKYKSIIRMFS